MEGRFLPSARDEVFLRQLVGRQLIDLLNIVDVVQRWPGLEFNVQLAATEQFRRSGLRKPVGFQSVSGWFRGRLPVGFQNLAHCFGTHAQRVLRATCSRWLLLRPSVGSTV